MSHIPKKLQIIKDALYAASGTIKILDRHSDVADEVLVQIEEAIKKLSEVQDEIGRKK